MKGKTPPQFIKGGKVSEKGGKGPPPKKGRYMHEVAEESVEAPGRKQKKGKAC